MQAHDNAETDESLQLVGKLQSAMLGLMRTLLLSAAVVLAAAPAAAADISVTDAWVRLPAVAGRPAAGYFMVMGKDRPATIVGVSSPSAKKAEIHESSMANGMMQMTPLPKLTVGKGQMVMLKPGGKHVMLFGLDPAIRPGGTVRLDLKLENGGTATVMARAVGAADTPPGQTPHHIDHHNH